MSNQFQPLVSVVIPVLNDPDRLRNCLMALEQQTYPKHRYEVIVVDNGSRESIEPIVEEFSQARAIAEPQPGSYSARNTGIRSAQGEVIALTDADCLPAMDWIEKGVAHLQQQNCGLVAGDIHLISQDPTHPTGVEWCDQFLFLRQKHYLENFHFGATANVFAFKQVFDQVGLFNASLKSGGDREWGERVYAAGYDQVFAADAWVSHPTRHSFPEFYNKVVRVARGSYAMGKEKRRSPQSLLQDIIKDAKPPFRIFFRTWFDKNLPRPQQKIQFLAALLMMKYVTAWEKLKLLLQDTFVKKDYRYSWTAD